jgi:hypothetical protein
LAQGFVEGQQAVVGWQLDAVVFLKFAPPSPPTMFQAFFAAGAIEEDAAHRLGRRREEVPATVPSLLVPAANQPQVRLVDQGRRVQRLPGRLVGHLPRCEPAQFVVNEREQVRSGVRVARLDGGQDVRDLIHRRHHIGLPGEFVASYQMARPLTRRL